MVIFNGDYMVIIWKNYLEKLSGDYLGTIRVMMGKQPILKEKSSGNHRLKTAKLTFRFPVNIPIIRLENMSFQGGSGNFMGNLHGDYLEKLSGKIIWGLSRDYPRYDGKATNIEGKILRKPSVKNSQINI